MRARRKEYSAVGLELRVLMCTQVSIETEYVNIGVCVCVHDPVHPCTHTVTQAHVSLLVLL